MLNAGPQRLGSRFFCGESGRKTLGGRGAGAAVCDFPLGKYAMQKPLAKALNRSGNPRNLNQIDSRTHQHEPTVAQRSAFSSEQKESLLKSRSLSSDAASVDETAELSRGIRAGWELQLTALCAEDAPRTIRFLTGAILACGGDVVSRRFGAAGEAAIEFEFVRAVCVEMYSVLIAAGLELGVDSHLALASLCQCTRETLESTAGDPVRAQLFIRAATAQAEIEGGPAPPRVA